MSDVQKMEAGVLTDLNTETFQTDDEDVRGAHALHSFMTKDIPVGGKDTS